MYNPPSPYKIPAFYTLKHFQPQNTTVFQYRMPFAVKIVKNLKITLSYTSIYFLVKMGDLENVTNGNKCLDTLTLITAYCFTFSSIY